MMEGSQPFHLAFSETESKMLTIIAGAKTTIEFLLASNQAVDVRDVTVAQPAKPIRDRFWIDNFRSNKPKRVNERKTNQFFPLFAEIPKLEFFRMLLAESNGLIADEQARRSFRKRRRCRCRDEPRTQLSLIEQTTQQIAGGFCGRVEFNLFYIGNLADVGDDNAVNRAVRRNRNAVHDPVDWVAEKFETRNERNIELAT